MQTKLLYVHNENNRVNNSVRYTVRIDNTNKGRYNIQESDANERVVQRSKDFMLKLTLIVMASCFNDEVFSAYL